ncbi:MAG: Crp/Fnr family transcriptional regulator [Agriterribacter sp.]
MTELEQYIKFNFEIIQPDELNEVSSLFNPTTLKKGDYFLKEGIRCDKFCFIKTGYLRVFAISGEKEITQWIASKGHLGTDFSSFFFNLPSRWTIQALENTELFTITKENYNKIGNIVPQWSNLERTFLIKCLTIIESRVFSHLSMSAEERYNFFFENNKELFNQVPLQYISSMLGMTPETFSRIRKATFQNS